MTWGGVITTLANWRKKILQSTTPNVYWTALSSMSRKVKKNPTVGNTTTVTSTRLNGVLVLFFQKGKWAFIRRSYFWGKNAQPSDRIGRWNLRDGLFTDPKKHVDSQYDETHRKGNDLVVVQERLILDLPEDRHQDEIVVNALHKEPERPMYKS